MRWLEHYLTHLIVNLEVTAENVASRQKISKEEQDQLVVESHLRAQRAT